jgi:S-phase kinase-associated protein 1
MANIVKLQSGDDLNAVFTVPYDVIKFSKTIDNMIEDLGEASFDAVIPMANVTKKMLEKVIVFCTHHAELPKKVTDTEVEVEANTEAKVETKTNVMNEWETEFCNMNQSDLFELILAANYLDVKPLLDLTCMAVANMIKGKSPEEIRKTFNIKNDFTPEEEEKVRKENEWCEDV